MSNGSDWEIQRVYSCIYCGSKENLTSEHIIPFSLGEKLELKGASCKVCADITSKFERTVARVMLGNFRIKFSAPTRRPRKRPSSLFLKALKGDEETNHEIKLEDHPGAFCLPILSPPRVKAGNVDIDGNLHQP